MNKIDLFNNYKIASEYHQAAFCTYGKGNNYERKFRYKLFKAMKEIRRVDRNFKFEPNIELVKIDYFLFGKKINDLILKEFDLLVAEEFNFVSHYCSGGMFMLHNATEMELKQHKDHYLCIHESDYIAVKRMALINDIIHQ